MTYSTPHVPTRIPRLVIFFSFPTISRGRLTHTNYKQAEGGRHHYMIAFSYHSSLPPDSYHNTEFVQPQTRPAFQPSSNKPTTIINPTSPSLPSLHPSIPPSHAHTPRCNNSLSQLPPPFPYPARSSPTEPLHSLLNPNLTRFNRSSIDSCV
jgi:hypothetical protein